MKFQLREFLTTRTVHVFDLAYALAADLGEREVSFVHLLVGMLREGRNIGAQILLHGRGISQFDLEKKLLSQLPSPRDPLQLDLQHSWTPADDRILAAIAEEAESLGVEFHGCEHLLLAALKDSHGASPLVLGGYGVTYSNVRADILRLY